MVDIGVRGGRTVLHLAGIPHVAKRPWPFGSAVEYAWALKNLADAVLLRNHVLELLERADVEPDAEQRRRLLTVVVAGAGFAGTEVVAELFDLVHTVSHYYPGVGQDESRFVLVHPGDRILPELPAELGEYARERLSVRGIECVLGVRAAEAEADRVLLTNGDLIDTRTFVWTAGNPPEPAAPPGRWHGAAGHGHGAGRGLPAARIPHQPVVDDQERGGSRTRRRRP